jgi:hypothetical protein
MQSAQSKGVMVDAVLSSARGSADRFSAEAKERRRKLITAINAGYSEQAEEADAALSKYLDELYPETRLSD